MMRTAVTQGTLDLAPLQANPAKKGAKLSFLELRPDALQGLKIGFEKMRQIKAEHWRTPQKSTKKASFSENGHFLKRLTLLS